MRPKLVMPVGHVSVGRRLVDWCSYAERSRSKYDIPATLRVRSKGCASFRDECLYDIRKLVFRRQCYVYGHDIRAYIADNPIIEIIQKLRFPG